MTTDTGTPPAGDETPAEDLTLEQQLEQVEEAADAVAEAINNGDTERAENILRQLETWRENLSSTLALARSQPNPELAETLEELRTLRDELSALRTPPNPSPPPPPSVPPLETPSPATPILTPPSDASQTEPPASAAQEEPPEPEPPAAPESQRQKRRAI